MNAIETVESADLKKALPQLNPGDTVRVHVRVKETNVKEEIKGKPKETERERVQVFEGIVIGLRGSGARATDDRAQGLLRDGVERIFPLHARTIEKIEVVKHAQVRRAKLYYLRERKGKAGRMKEKRRGGTGRGGLGRLRAREASQRRRGSSGPAGDREAAMAAGVEAGPATAGPPGVELRCGTRFEDEARAEGHRGHRGRRRGGAGCALRPGGGGGGGPRGGLRRRGPRRLEAPHPAPARGARRARPRAGPRRGRSALAVARGDRPREHPAGHPAGDAAGGRRPCPWRPTSSWWTP